MKKSVLIISPHGDDEIISSWTSLLLSKNKKINLHIIFQAVNEENRLSIIDKISKEMNFTYDVAFPGFDAKMDELNMREIVSYYDTKIGNVYDTIIIPSKSFHKDHKIAHEACIAALRRNTKSSILKAEHPFIISQITDDFTPNLYMPFNDIKDKIKYLGYYKQFLRSEDMDITFKLNAFRGQQINKNYAETFQIIRKIENEQY